jgi:dUTPase
MTKEILMDNLPRFLVEEQIHIPDQKNSGDAGFDLRCKITKEEGDNNKGRNRLLSWAESNIVRIKAFLQDKSSLDGEGLRVNPAPIYLNGDLVLGLETLDEYKATDESYLNLNTHEWYSLNAQNPEALLAWFEKLKWLIVSTENVVALLPGDNYLFNAGFKVALPSPTVCSLKSIDAGMFLNISDQEVILPISYEMDIHARSGLACKHGLIIRNQVGIVDSGYRDAVLISLENSSKNAVHLISDKARIAQAVFRLCLNLGQIQYRSELQVNETEFNLLSEQSNRGGGIGSTGV